MGKTLRWLAMFALVLSLSCVLLPVYGQDLDVVDEGTTEPGLEEEGLGAGGDELTEGDGLTADAIAGDYETDKALEAQMKAEEAKRQAKAAFEAGDYGMAVSKLQEAVECVPDDEETLSRLEEVQKAYIYDLLKSDNYDAVIAQADNFLARFTDPEDAAVMQVANFRSTAVEMAAAASEAVTPTEGGEEAGALPRTDSGLLLQARQAYRKKDYNLARDLLLEAREINPYNVEVMRLLDRTTDQMYLYSRSEREYIRASMVLDIQDTWNKRPRRAEASVGPLDMPKEEPIPKPRQEILAKLDTIIEVVDFKDAQLEEVINYLARAANVNIVIDPVVFWTPGGTAGPETGGGGFTPGGETFPSEGPLEIPGGAGPAPGEFGDLAPQGMPGGGPGGGRPGGFGTEPGFGTGTGGFGTGTGGFGTGAGTGAGGFGTGTGMGGYAAPQSSTITIHLVGAPLREVLRYVLRYKNLKYVVEDYAILIIPIDYVLPEEMITEIFRLSTSGIGISTMQPTSDWGTGTGFGGGGGTGGTGGGGFGGGGTGGGFGGGGTGGGFGMGGEGGGVGQPETIEEWLRRAGGVTWPPGSNLVYHQSTAVLVVTNTPSNMQLVRELVKIWDKPPMQVEVEARFAEVAMSRDFENSFEANMLDALRWTRNSESAWGTKPLGARERVELLAVPGETLRTVVDPYGGWLSIKGILTRPEFELVWHSLEQTDYTEILNAPRVTTISGQQALIQVVERIRYPTEYETESLQDVYLSGVSAEDLQAFMLTPSAFEEADIGIRLTVTPTVSSDGQVITLVLLPEVSELVDWDDYGTPLNPARQPRFKMRNITTTVYINDGETLVLGGIIESNNDLIQDRVPVLGSVPILGRLFRSTYETEEKSNLMVFVTADLITSRGTRVRQENQIRERRRKFVDELARRREAAEAM